MANRDNPNGFRIADARDNPRANPYQTASGETIAVGDAVLLDGSGQVTIGLATSGTLLGIAASAVTSSSAGDQIFVYDDPEQEFEAQCSGTFALTMLGAECDLEGTTGIMEVNENASTYSVLRIVGYNSEDEVGANTRVHVRIAKAQTGEADGEFAKLSVAGAATVGTTLGVTGAATVGSLTDGTATLDGSGNLSGVDALTATGAVTGGSFTDGTLTIDGSGNVTGADAITATGAVTGGSFTDGTLTIDGSGNVTGADAITATGAVTGGSFTDGTLTIDGSGNVTGADAITATGAVTGGSFTDGTLTIDGSGNVTGADAITATGAVTGGSFTDGTATLDGSGNLSGVGTLTTTGKATVGGDLELTGHMDGYDTSCCPVIGVSGECEPYANSTGPVFGLAHVPQSQTAVYGLLPITVNVGDEIVGARLAGFAVENNALTLDAEIVSVAIADGTTTVLTATTGFVQVAAGGTFNQAWELDAVAVTDPAHFYGIRILATTGATDTITVTVANIKRNRA